MNEYRVSMQQNRGSEEPLKLGLQIGLKSLVAVTREVMFHKDLEGKGWGEFARRAKETRKLLAERTFRARSACWHTWAPGDLRGVAAGELGGSLNQGWHHRLSWGKNLDWATQGWQRHLLCQTGFPVPWVGRCQWLYLVRTVEVLS